MERPVARFHGHLADRQERSTQTEEGDLPLAGPGKYYTGKSYRSMLTVWLPNTIKELFFAHGLLPFIAGPQ